MQYLVDTGVWLRLFDRADAGHGEIRQALQTLRAQGHSLAVCPQNIAEFWNVSTRPASARGGYGKSVATTQLRVLFVERSAKILDDSPQAYQAWRQLLVQHQIQGLSVHDARLVSMMQTASITHVVTLNASDFTRYPAIVAVTPGDISASISP